ncbi:hypothetical protein OL229_15550 [Neisseriaceae bacterium JH1-16]|nr:hypothetical protein [Neisseriaceae bacterium JH1-16]
MNYSSERSKYNYPAAHLRVFGDLPIAYENFIYVRHSEPLHIDPSVTFHSTRSLDSYHGKLLCSENVNDIALGLASVTYWGNYWVKGHANHGLAEARVKRLFFGNARSKKSIDTYGINNLPIALRHATDLIDKNQFGLALKEICEIPWVSIAFGTKILSFVCPEKIGVYDVHISRALGGTSSEMPATGPISKAVVNSYNQYCGYLIDKAYQLNVESSCKWKDWDGADHEWRAVDVERAYFSRAINA